MTKGESQIKASNKETLVIIAWCIGSVAAASMIVGILLVISTSSRMLLSIQAGILLLLAAVNIQLQRKGIAGTNRRKVYLYYALPIFASMSAWMVSFQYPKGQGMDFDLLVDILLVILLIITVLRFYRRIAKF